jgi:hypothetical protein
MSLQKVDQFQIPDSARAILTKERDVREAALQAAANEMHEMSCLDFLAKGIHRDSVRNFELVGRLARAGWRSLDYNTSKPGWRVYDDLGYERYVTANEVLVMLTCSSDSGGEP